MDTKKKPKNRGIRDQWNIPVNARLIISVANLVPVKGIEILIGAFEKLSSSYPDWRLMIVGDDTTAYGQQLKNNLSKRSNIKENVLFIGKQKNVCQFLDIAEIYVQPTLNQGRREGAPIAILEALANGKVILGSDIPGIRDQLGPFPDHLFKAGDIVDLSKKISQFMSNDRINNVKLGEKFINHVKKYYDLSKENNKLELFYKVIHEN